MDKKVDIFEVLKKIDQCDLSYFKAMSEAEKKSLHPLVLMRWLSGTKDVKQITRINSVLNPFVFQLHKEKDLLIKLLMCSSTSSKTYRWYAKKKQNKRSIDLDIISEYYDCSIKEAIGYVDMIPKEDLISMAESIGYDKEQIKKLK